MRTTLAFLLALCYVALSKTTSLPSGERQLLQFSLYNIILLFTEQVLLKSQAMVLHFMWE